MSTCVKDKSKPCPLDGILSGAKNRSEWQWECIEESFEGATMWAMNTDNPRVGKGSTVPIISWVDPLYCKAEAWILAIKNKDCKLDECLSIHCSGI
jgi:hypothetical protein